MALELFTKINQGWFLLVDKWHRDSQIHFIKEGQTRTVCGKMEISQVSVESMIYFNEISNCMLGDVCICCIKKEL